MKILDFLRNRIPFFAVLLFLSSAWCFAEWKYPIAKFCSSLLIQMDEPPEFTRVSIEKKEKISTYAPKEKLSGSCPVQRKAGQLNVNPHWDGTLPITGQHQPNNYFISDTFLRNWAVIAAKGNADGTAYANLNAALACQPECGDAAITCTDANAFHPEKWRNLLFTSLKGELDMNKAFPDRNKNKTCAAYMLAGIRAEQAYPNAKILLAYDGMIKLFLNGKEVYQSKKESVRKNIFFPVDVQLCKGVNTLLIKTVCSKSQWSLQIRITDYQDEPLFFIGETSF